MRRPDKDAALKREGKKPAGERKGERARGMRYLLRSMNFRGA